MLLELFELGQELKAAPVKLKRAIAQTAAELGFDVLPTIHANVKRGPNGWEVVAASTDPKILPEPAADEFRAEGRLDFSRGDVPAGVTDKGPNENG